MLDAFEEPASGDRTIIVLDEGLSMFAVTVELLWTFEVMKITQLFP